MKIDEPKIQRGPQAAGGAVGRHGGCRESRDGGGAAVRVHELVRACGPVELLRPERVRRARAAVANGNHGSDVREVARSLLRELLANVVS